MQSKQYLEKYGAWAGNPKGTKPNYNKCAESVADGYRFKQCSRPNGHGPDCAFCKQHAKKFIKE